MAYWFAAMVAALLAAGIVLHFRKRSQLFIELRTVEPQLTEIDLVNPTHSDVDLDRDLAVTWDGGSLLGSGGLAGFDPGVNSDHGLIFKPSATTRPSPLRALESRAIGWVRLSDNSAVHAQFSDAP